MKKLLFPFLLLISAVTFAADPGTWTGYVSDSHCGADGAKEGHVACAKKCVKEGYAPIFVVDGKVYAIDNPKKVSKYLGEKVTVTGTITGDKIEIDKVSK